MRRNFLLLLIAFSTLSCTGQSNSNAWLSERYVNAIQANDTSRQQFLIPVEGFESFDKTPRILMYRGEINPVKTKKVIIKGKEKYQLLNLQYYVNLKYSSRELATRLAKATIYLSRDKNKLRLEIIEKDKREDIYFVDRIEGYEFKSIREAKKHLERS